LETWRTSYIVRVLILKNFRTLQDLQVRFAGLWHNPGISTNSILTIHSVTVQSRVEKKLFSNLAPVVCNLFAYLQVSEGSSFSFTAACCPAPDLKLLQVNYKTFQDLNFQDFSGTYSFSRTFQVTENLLKKICDFPGGTGTLTI